MQHRRVLTPRQALLAVMEEKGVESLGVKVWMQRQRLARLGFQHAAVEMLVRGYSASPGPVGGMGVVWEEEWRGRRYRLLQGHGSETADAVIVEDSGPALFAWQDLEARLPDPPFPLFVVDLVLRHIHTAEELSRLRVQIAVALTTIREYLWDRHLAVTSADRETAVWLSEAFGAHKAIITRSRPNEILWDIGAERVFVLRPDAPEDLSAEDVMEADAFLIGGIVDRIPRKGISRVLDNLVPWGVARRISLRGSIIGVPERINRIVEILLKARFLYNGNVEKAVLSTMTKKDVIARAYAEISRAARNVGGRRVVDWGLYEQLRTWLPIREKEFLEAARRAGVEVVGSKG